MMKLSTENFPLLPQLRELQREYPDDIALQTDLLSLLLTIDKFFRDDPTITPELFTDIWNEIAERWTEALGAEPGSFGVPAAPEWERMQRMHQAALELQWPMPAGIKLH